MALRGWKRNEYRILTGSWMNTMKDPSMGGRITP
jgi:hypothetical protein